MTTLSHGAEPEVVVEAVERAADAWGGRFDRTGRHGELLLPVQAGVRHGVLRGEVTVAPQEEGSRLELSIQKIDYRVHRPAVAMLLLGTAAAAVLVLWPFVPGLEGLLPIALILTIGSWFLVVARLQNRGPEEFLATVDAFAAAHGEEPPLEGPIPTGAAWEDSAPPAEAEPETVADPASDPRPKKPSIWS